MAVHIRKRKDSRYFWFDYIDEKGNRIQRSSKTTDKKLAKTAAAKLEIEIDRKRLGLDSAEEKQNFLTIDQFHSQLSQYINTRYIDRTAETYIMRLTNFTTFLESIKLVNIFEVTPQIVEQYITSRINVVKNVTINNEITHIKAVFNIAIKLNFIDKNPFAGIKNLPVKKKQPFWYKKEEIQTIFSHIPWRFKPHFYVLLDTGIRPGEMALLHWEDIDYDKALLNITTRRSEAKMRPRSIPLTARSLAAFQERKQLAEHPVYIFSSQSGKLLHKNTLRNVFIRAKIKANIRTGRVYDLRHTFASWLVQSGESIYLVSYLLGHSSVKMTEIYAHLAPKKNETEKMNRIFNY